MTRIKDRIADHSNRGENVNLFAVGEGIKSFGLDNSTLTASGLDAHGVTVTAEMVAQIKPLIKDAVDA